MKKIFTKLIGVTLGLAMAVGVGVGVAANSRAATKLDADATYTWQKVTSKSEFVNGAVLLVTQSTYYLDVSGTGDQTPRQGSLTLSNGLPTLTANNSNTFTVTTSGTGLKLCKSTDVSKWLITGNSNNAARINTGTTGHLWTIEDGPTSGEFYLKSNVNRYLSRYQTTDFRSYTGTGTNANLILYKLVEVTKQLSSIALSGTYPTSFTQGDEFSHDGMTVTATYDDDSTADVTANASFSGFNMSNAGNQTVTVSYTENGTTKTATYGITVNAATMYTVGGTIQNGHLSSTASIRENNELSITLIADQNYSLPDEIEVIMGGSTLVVDDDYLYGSNDGSIYIDQVTGNIVINAECSKTKGLWADDPYTVSEAWDIVDGLSQSGGNTNYVAYVSGTIASNPTINNHDGADFNITDGVKSLVVYSVAGAKITRDEGAGTYIENGYSVVVSGALIKYVKNATTTYEVGYKSAQLPGTLVSAVAPSFSVIYNANGATSGDVPVDNVQHAKYTNAIVLDNTGSLAKTDYEFNGWNTHADPTADGAHHYDAGDELEILGNTTLYAEWLSTAPSITVQANLAGFTNSSTDLSFTYGYIANPLSSITVDAADDKVVVGAISASNGSGSVAITFSKAGDTSLSFKNGGVELAVCSVTVTQSTVTITGLPATGNVYVNKTLDLGSKISVSHIGAYSEDVTWDSDDDDIATVDNNGVVTGKAEGTVDITVTADDYPSATMTCAVTVSFAPDYKVFVADEIAVGDTVILASDGEGSVLQQYVGPSDTATVYGLSEDYTTAPDPFGTTFMVVAGNSENTFAFKIMSGENKDKYLSWTTGNSLNVNAVLSDNTSWKVTIDNNGNATIKNAADEARVLWWNVDYPRFACYTGKSDDDTYKYVQLWKVADPETYLANASSVASLIATETEPGVVSSVMIKLGAEISVEDWTAINSKWTITDYGVMLFRTTQANLASVSTVKEYYKANPANVTIVSNGNGTAPDPDGDVYRFSVQVNIRNASSYSRIYCAAPYIVAGGRYYFLSEMRESVNSLASNYSGSDLSAATLEYLASAH